MRKCKHGLSKTYLYGAWARTRNGCNNPYSQAFRWLGSKGIVMCPEWDDDFMNFYKWALENGYHEGLYIQRKDLDGDFEPSNCYFGTGYKPHAKRVCLLTWNGETHSIKDWSRILGVCYEMLKHRWQKGLPVEEILFREKRKPYTLTYKGETHTVSEWSKLLGVSDIVIRERMRKGWTPEECLFSKEQYRKCTKVTP